MKYCLLKIQHMGGFLCMCFVMFVCTLCMNYIWVINRLKDQDSRVKCSMYFEWEKWNNYSPQWVMRGLFIWKCQNTQMWNVLSLNCLGFYVVVFCFSFFLFKRDLKNINKNPHHVIVGQFSNNGVDALPRRERAETLNGKNWKLLTN